MAETKIGGRDIKDSNVEAIDLNFASAEAMILSATATGFVVWDRTASKAKEVRLSVLETYFNTKYPLTTDSRINNGQTAFDWGNHAGKYVDLLTNQASIGGNKTFNNKIFLLDTLSLGTSASGERLHIADGNIFLDGGGETAFKTRRLTTFTNTHVNSPFINPTFQIGRIIQGGDGAPQFRWMYNDNVVGETVVMELDSEGIMSSVRQERGSHFEGHIANEANPFFRINSFPDIRLEFGQGSTFATDVSVSRPSANVLSFNRGSGGSEVSSMKIDASGNVGVGLNPLYRVHSSGDIKADWNLRAGDSVYTSGVKLGWDTIEQYGADIDGASIAINYNGFNGGITRFRNLGVFDGKNGIIWDVVGSTKKTQFYGDVGTQQNFIAAGTVSALGGSSTQWNIAVGWGNHAGLYSNSNHTHTFASLTSKPTTLSGYGITDALASLYTFEPGSSNGIRRWVRLATLNGVSTSSGANIDFILAGMGDFGSSQRGNLHVIAGQRGVGGVGIKVYSLNTENTQDPVEIHYVIKSDFVFEIWAYLSDYNYTHQLTVLQSYGTVINTDSITTTAPVGAVLVPRIDILNNSNFVAGTGSTNYAAGNDSRLSDARTPLAHTHAYLPLAGGQTTGAVGIGGNIQSGYILDVAGSSVTRGSVFLSSGLHYFGTGDFTIHNTAGNVRVKNVVISENTVTATTFIGALTGNATSATNVGGVLPSQIVYGVGLNATSSARVDANTLFKSGFYYAGGGATSVPISGRLIVSGYDAGSSSYRGNILLGEDGNMHFRTEAGTLNSWTTWRKIWDSNNLTNLNQLTTRNYTDLQNIPTLDNYQSWNLKTGGVQRIAITSGGTLDIVGGTNVTATYGAGGVVTLSSTDTNTTYTGSLGIALSGTDFRPTYGTAANTITQGNDARLSDARTPLSHSLLSHTAITLAQLSTLISDATLISSTDSRLSDARTPLAHNHTTLTGVTSISFATDPSDTASISTTINGSGTYFDFNLTDDNNNDWWRWRFTPSGSTVYDAMTLKPVANGISNLTVSGSVLGANLSGTNTGDNPGVTSVSSSGGYGGLTLTGVSATASTVILGGTPTGTWPIGITGNSSTASNLSNIPTNFSGVYPITVNVSGTIYSHAGMTYNGTTGTLLAPTFSGALSGNATTATTLLNARNINGVSFNGSSDISLKNIISQGLNSAETLRNSLSTGIYTYNVTNASLGGNTPVSYWSVLDWGLGTGGSAQLATSWTGGGTSMWFRSLRDTTDNWWEWKELIHSSNFNNYTTTKTGTGASGTWPISITGNTNILGNYTANFQTVTGTTDYLIGRDPTGNNLSLASWASVKSNLGLNLVDNTADANKSVNYANTTGSAPWTGITGKPGWMNQASLVASHNNANSWMNSGFYENDGAGVNWPSQTWYNSINVRHSNQGNYHGFQIANSYYDNKLWHRSYNGLGTFEPWVYTIDSNTIGSQTVANATNMLPLVGGTLSGALNGTSATFSSSVTAGGNIYATSSLFLNNKSAIDGGDSWLRINQNNSFTSGIYCATGILRTDGNFQVGASGASFNVTSTGAVTAALSVTAEGLIVRSNSGLQLRNATNDAWATLGFDGSRVTSNYGISTPSITTMGNSSFNYTHGNYTRFGILAAQNGASSGDSFMYIWNSEPGATWTGGGFSRNIYNLNGNFPRVNSGLSGQMLHFRESGEIALVQENASGVRYQSLTFNLSGAATFASTVTATAFYGPSDMRLKTLVDKVHTSSVSNIEEISYLWKDKSNGEGIQVGYDASKVKEHMPHAVNTDDKGFMSVNYIQVLVAKVADLEKRLKQLEYGI